MQPCIIDEENLLNIEDQLCFALYSTSRAITKQYALLLESLGITYSQYLAMMVLWKQDGILVQKIAKNLEIDQATATPLVQRLEKLNLVIRKRSVDDERKVQIFLTKKGKALYKKALSVPGNLGCAINVDSTKAKCIIEELNEIKLYMKQKN